MHRAIQQPKGKQDIMQAQLKVLAIYVPKCGGPEKGREGGIVTQLESPKEVMRGMKEAPEG